MIQALNKSILISLSLFSAAAFAQTPKTLSLSDCLETGLRNNLDLEVHKLDVEFVKQTFAASRAVYDSRFGAGLTYEDSELPSSSTFLQGRSKTLLALASLNRTFYQGTTLGLEASSQQFKFPDAMDRADEVNISSIRLTLSQPLLKNAGGQTDRLRIQAAAAGYARASLDYVYARDVLAARIYQAYWSDYTALEALKVEKNAVERSRSLLEKNRRKFKDGLLDETDILAAEAALATREVNVIERKNGKSGTHDELMQVLRVPIKQWDAVRLGYEETRNEPASKQPSAQEAYRNARQHRPDLMALNVAREQASDQVKIREDELKPELSLVGGFGIGNSAESLGDSVGSDKAAWSIGVQFRVPWHRIAERAALEQAKIRLRQVEHQQDELESLVLLHCRRSARDLQTAGERMKATRKARDLHAKKLGMEEQKLKQGRSSTRLIIEYQDDLEFAELATVQAVADYQIKQAQHLLVQGLLLKNNQNLEHPRKPE